MGSIPCQVRRFLLYTENSEGGASPAADPASPVHKTDGSDREKVEKDSAKYAFNVNVNTAAISFTKENIRLGFSEIRDIPEYSLVAEHRYRSSDRRIASVNKKRKGCRF